VATANLGLNVTSWLSRISQIILDCLHQQDKLKAHRFTTQGCKLKLTGVCFSVQVVHAELEAAKLQISTLKAQLIISHEAVDSARAASDSLAQQMKKSADTELSRVVQQVDTAEAEVHHLQDLLANTQADAKSQVAKLQANAASAQQDVKRLEQQLAGSQTAAAQQEEELKKLHKAELKSEVQALCISLLHKCAGLQPPPPPRQPPPVHLLLHTLLSLTTEPPWFWAALLPIRLLTRLHALSLRLVSTFSGVCNAQCITGRPALQTLVHMHCHAPACPSRYS